MFCASCAWSLGERIILALHRADAESSPSFGRGRGGKRGQGALAPGPRGGGNAPPGVTLVAGMAESSGSPAPAPAGGTDRRSCDSATDRHRARRRPRGIRILAGIEGIATAPARAGGTSR